MPGNENSVVLKAKYIWTTASLKTAIFWIKIPTQINRRYSNCCRVLPVCNYAPVSDRDYCYEPLKQWEQNCALLFFYLFWNCQAKVLLRHRCRMLPWICEKKYTQTFPPPTAFPLMLADKLTIWCTKKLEDHTGNYCSKQSKNLPTSFSLMLQHISDFVYAHKFAPNRLKVESLKHWFKVE